MYCHHRHLRGLAGSRARVFRARKTRIPRAQSLFFCISFTGNVWLNLVLYADIFLCNHKHIQSFVNSVLIIAKTLSLSPSLARAFSIEASYRERERERERKKEKKRYTILIFFSCEEKKAFKAKKRRKGKRLEKRPRKPWQKRRHKIIIFARPLSLSLSIL